MAPAEPPAGAVDGTPLVAGDSARPAVHLTPPVGWMNDPNGLVLHGGVWHACYQHNPAGPVHGDLHWRRATSTDLVHWTDRGVMLAPDHLGQIYSGSIVVDHVGSAGFGAGSMIAVFTHHLRDGVQRQSLAWSTDGERWTAYAGNPVLESDAHDFRDPKVVRWDGPTGAWWVMALAVGDHVEVYRSPDLRTWTLTSRVSAHLPGAGVWECPDLVRLGAARQGDGTAPWLLVFGVAEGGPGGHSGTLGLRGRFDGERFEPEGVPFLLDHGPDCYAMQTFSGTPAVDRPAVALAWMSSWRYASAYPAPHGWLGRMTIPRSIELDRAGRIVTRMPPLPTSDSGNAPNSRALRIDGAGPMSVTVTDATDSATTLTVTVGGGQVVLERTGTTIAHYAGRFEAPLTGDGGTTILVDHGSVEVFADGGAVTLTALAAVGPRWTCTVDGDVVRRAVG